MIRSVEILVDLVARSSGRKLSANEQAEFDQAKNAVEALLSAGGQRVARVEIGPGLGYGDGPLYLPHNTREGGGFSAVFVPAWAESLRQVAALAHPVAEQRERERAACRSAEEALAARVRHLLAEEVANRDALASWSREARAIVATDVEVNGRGSWHGFSEHAAVLLRRAAELALRHGCPSAVLDKLASLSAPNSRQVQSSMQATAALMALTEWCEAESPSPAKKR